MWCNVLECVCNVFDIIAISSIISKATMSFINQANATKFMTGRN